MDLACIGPQKTNKHDTATMLDLQFAMRVLSDRQTVRPFEFQQNVQNRLEKSTDWFSLVQKVT